MKAKRIAGESESLSHALKHRGNDRRLWNAIVDAAQAAYIPNEEYGISNQDMERALKAAFLEWEKRK